MNTSFAERMYNAGFHDLLPIIPPGASLMPSSTVAQASLGKIPGIKHASGLWSGVNWRTLNASRDDVRGWVLDGANIGLRTTNHPCFDLDIGDAGLAAMVETAVRGQCGDACVRTGKAPKRLLLYSLAPGATPFSRMRLWVTSRDGARHLVEVLCEGQQAVVSGTHPATGQPYSWDRDPSTVKAAGITRESASAALDYLAELIDVSGIGTTEREGDGKRSTRTPDADQHGLLAPSIDALRACVAAIPNADAIFHSRSDYLRIGYSIRAAAGAAHDEEGFAIFADWCSRWDSESGVNDPETVRDDYRRMSGEKSVGWGFLAQTARGYGYNDVAEEFDVTTEAPVTASEIFTPPAYSDQDLAEIIISRTRSVLRYVPQKGAWLVWDGVRWVIDAELQAEDVIIQGLKRIAAEVMRQGVTEKEQRASAETAKVICSAGKATAAAQIIRASRSIAVSMNALDHELWFLNTPGGIVDLKTGKLWPSEPDALCTKSTAVPPDFTEGARPEWARFIAEATNGDHDLESYLQRLAGYALTGSTKEEQVAFLHGSGGNGKSVFVNALSDILGDYAETADMSTFTASNFDKHTTDLAMLAGARLVTANESTAGKRWDDQRIKALTGGEMVTARFMHKNNFKFRPQFKLLFSGNHQPELRDVGDAMRRRIHMVPFTTKPAVVDRELSEKLRAEYPAILAWMIQGCLAWQAEGLTPPTVVRQATDEYFENEDAYGKWVHECVLLQPGDAYAGATTGDLFQSWMEWANPRKEHVGSMKRLASALVARGWQRWQEPVTRRMGFKGVSILARSGFEAMS